MSEADLGALPSLAFAFVLVLCRTSAAVMLMPGLGEADPPPMVRAGLSLAFSVLLVPAVAPRVPAVSAGLAGLGMVGCEVLTGATLGWLARLPSLALSMAGAIASTSMGLSSVVQPDPALGGQSSALARGLGVASPVLIFASGLYVLPLRALAGSYQLVGAGEVLGSELVTQSVEQAMTAAIALSLRLAAPFLVAGILLYAALGLLSRLVPNLQVFTVAMPGQILGGLVLLGLLIGPLFAAWSETVMTAWSALPGM